MFGGGELTFTLMSDLHLGAPNVNRARIREDLEEAKKHSDRILLDGDIFDAILPTDVKRFLPGVLENDLRGRQNILNQVVKTAFDLLYPYATLIDLIACGNHEESVEKHHHFDLVQELVRRLNEVPGADVRYGGIGGYFGYRIQETCDSDAARERENPGGDRWWYLIFYHHGAGGNAIVTKGMIGFNRMQTWVEADLIWVGHGHNKIHDATPVRQTMNSRGKIVERPRHCVMTGGYLGRGEPDTHEDFMSGKPKSVSYAESKNLPPQDAGGARVIVPLLDNAQIGRVKIVM